MIRSFEGSLPSARSIVSGISAGIRGRAARRKIRDASAMQCTFLFTPADDGCLDNETLCSFFEDKGKLFEHKDGFCRHPKHSSQCEVVEEHGNSCTASIQLSLLNSHHKH